MHCSARSSGVRVLAFEACAALVKGRKMRYCLGIRVCRYVPVCRYVGMYVQRTHVCWNVKNTIASTSNITIIIIVIIVYTVISQAGMAMLIYKHNSHHKNKNYTYKYSYVQNIIQKYSTAQYDVE